MKLHRLSADNRCRGFTLIELLASLAIMIVIFALGIPVALNFYKVYQLNSETDFLVALLENSRNSALININESDNGVYIGSNEFVIFQGDDYGTRDVSQDQAFSKSTAITISGAGEVVFESLSGRTASTTLTISNGASTKFIYINEEGRIQY